MEKLTFARDQYQKYTSATQTRRDYIASMIMSIFTVAYKKVKSTTMSR
jgi:hypothetical protein